MRDARWMVMVGDGLDRQIWDTPKAKQEGADLCMGSAEKFLFRRKDLATTLFDERVHPAEFAGQIAGQNQRAYIVKKRSENGEVATLLVDGKFGRNRGYALRVLLQGLMRCTGECALSGTKILTVSATRTRFLIVPIPR